MFAFRWCGVFVSDYLKILIQHALIKYLVPGSLLVVLGDKEMSETMRADPCPAERRPAS